MNTKSASAISGRSERTPIKVGRMRCQRVAETDAQMSVTHDQFLADVAAIYIGDSSKGSFGSGRLIGARFCPDRGPRR